MLHSTFVVFLLAGAAMARATPRSPDANPQPIEASVPTPSCTLSAAANQPVPDVSNQPAPPAPSVPYMPEAPQEDDDDSDDDSASYGSDSESDSGYDPLLDKPTPFDPCTAARFTPDPQFPNPFGSSTWDPCKTGQYKARGVRYPSKRR